MKKEILLNKVIDKVGDIKIEVEIYQKNGRKNKKTLKKILALVKKANIILEKENRKNEKE